MQIFSEQFTGTDGGPPSTQAYKRAVYKQPPRHFTVHVLAPQKHGNAFSYGMHITPLLDVSDRRSIISRSSDNSNGSSGSGSASGSQTSSSPDSTTTTPFTSDYEVWRRWEDCLYFQDILEVQYGIMSREKRARLHAGKGVKKNGLYAHEDPLRRHHRAASFESLPPGPDPAMIAKDVHEVLPRLTKKGTLFKASKDTIEQRGNEFKVLIEALLREGDDVPTLITELRQLRIVRDFFGFWRRDYDRLERLKLNDDDKASTRRRSESLGSRASSVFGSGGFGMYFNASNLSLSPATSPPEPYPQKAPRRPPIMQGGKGAMLTVFPSNNEPGPSRTPQVVRQRAQTIQGMTGIEYGASISRLGLPASASSSNMQTIIPRPPASAPAGIGFMAAREDDNGYYSDTASVAESATSSQAFQSPVGSPRTQGMPGSPHVPDDIRHSDATVAGAVSVKGKGRAVDVKVGGAIIVDLKAGDTLPFDEEAHLLVLREHERLIPRNVEHFYEAPENRLGTRRGLQDLTIKEEDECEDAQDRRDSQDDYPHSEYQRSESSMEQGAEEHLQPTIPRVPRSSIAYGNRNCFFFRQSASSTDDDASADSLSVLNAERPRSPESSSRSHTPVSSARAAAAHADALNALTGGLTSRMRPSSPVSAKLFSPSSVRSSVHTTGSGSGSTSVSSGFGVPSLDTQSNYDMRPASVERSVTSCVDIGSRLTSSPVVLHTTLFGEVEHDEDTADHNHDADGQECSRMQHRAHDSMCSVRTFMTECSADAIIPHPREVRSESPSLPLSLSPAWRCMSALLGRNSSMSQMSGVSTQDNDDGEDLLDAYFYGVTSPIDEFDKSSSRGSLATGREHVRGSLARPDNFPKPFQNRPPGQFHLPWVPPRPASPGVPVSARSSVLTVDSSLSFSVCVSPSVSTISSPPTSASYASSIAPSLASAGVVSIKAVCGEHIVAFRTERGTPFADVREKLRHKLVDEVGVALAAHFALAYKPAAAGRVQELRAAFGRSRSSSVSSVGAPDPSSLRIIFSQRDWLDAVNSCAPGAKLTIHVLNG